MSNPAVIKLSEKRINKTRVYLDDNYGESIHIHIDEYRVDLTVHELRQMYDDICMSLNSLVGVDGFNAFDLDPVFLSHMLWRNLEHLRQVKYDIVRLSDMLCSYETKLYKLKDSMGVKMLKGQVEETEDYRKCNHLGQSDKERYQELYDSIKQNGYPYNNNYIVMYGNDNIIRDGQHRAACLYLMYGDIEVPVVRFFFDNYESPHVNALYNTKVSLYARSLRKAFVKYSRASAVLVKRACKKIQNKHRVNTLPPLQNQKEIMSLFVSK